MTTKGNNGNIILFKLCVALDIQELSGFSADGCVVVDFEFP